MSTKNAGTLGVLFGAAKIGRAIGDDVSPRQVRHLARAGLIRVSHAGRLISTTHERLAEDVAAWPQNSPPKREG